MTKLVRTTTAQTHRVEHFVNAATRCANRAGDELQVLLTRKRRKELGLLYDGAHSVDDLINSQRHLVVEDSNMTGVCSDQSEEHPDGGCLPGAVGAQEAVDSAYRHPQVEPVNGGAFADAGAIHLPQAVRLDGVINDGRRDDGPTANAGGRRPQVRRHRLQPSGGLCPALTRCRGTGRIPRRPKSAANAE